MIRRLRQAVAVVFVLAVLGPCAWLSAQATTAQQETARDAWQQVPEILAALEIGPDAVVADVGAGGGFLTARLARAVGPGGRVLPPLPPLPPAGPSKMSVSLSLKYSWLRKKS